MEARVLELLNDESLAEGILNDAKALNLDNNEINYLNYNLGNFAPEYEQNIYFYNDHFKISNKLHTDNIAMLKVMKLANQIASDKIKVTVFCNIMKPSLWNCKLSNPRYLHYGEFLCSPNPDKIIYVDTYNFSSGKDKCDKVYFLCNEPVIGNLTFVKCLTNTFFLSDKALELYTKNNPKPTNYHIINIKHDNRSNDVCYIRGSSVLDNIIYSSPYNIKLLSNLDDGKFKGETITERRKQNEALYNSKVCIYDGDVDDIKKRITSRGCLLLSSRPQDNDKLVSLSDGLNRALSILLKEEQDDSERFLSLL